MRARLLLLAVLACARRPPPEPRGPDLVVERTSLQVTRINRVQFLVGDLPRARAFYGDFLGFPWLPGAGDTATVTINEGQAIELQVGPAGADGRLGAVTLASNVSWELRDPDGHAIRLGQPGWFRDQPSRRGPLTGGRVATHIAHVGILVGGVEASLHFYRALGLREIWRGSADGKILSWINLRVPDGEDYLELMLYDQRPAPEQSGGKHHVCLSTPDVAAAVAVLEARRGGYARPIEIKVGRNGKRQANLFDPDGTRVELMEPVTADGKPVPPSPAAPPRP